MSKILPREQVSDVWWPASEGPETYDFERIFGNRQPVELDLGCGKGLFLFTQSRARPDHNYLGIDWSQKFSRQGASRIVRHQIPNVRIIAGDAWMLWDRFPASSFRAVHIYFPDPWWKTRHRKRRMVRPELLPHLHRLLEADGTLHVATDVREYFGVMLEVLAGSDRLIRLPDPAPLAGETDLDYLTHFERKYRRSGRSIHRAEYQLGPSSRT